MEKICTLREWVESSVAQSYFGTTLERIAVAAKFIGKCSEIDTRCVDRVKNDIIFAELNPDTILLKIIDDNGVIAYDIDFVKKDDKKVLKNTYYSNFDYASSLVLNKYSIGKEKGKEDSVYDVAVHLSKEDKAYAIAVNLFYIIFACHPFKGATYYSSPIENAEKELEFFINSKKFIFDSNYYAEEKIDGYHKCPNDVWNKLNDNQRAFFEKALSDDCYNLRRLFEEWKKYFSYSTIVLKTICGEDIDAFMFREDHSLIATDIAIWENLAKCALCKKELKSKCKSCPNAANALVTVTSMEIKITVTDANLGRSATHSTENVICLRVGDLLKGKDLDAKKGGDDNVFRVIPTKKLGVIGCEYLGEHPIALVNVDATAAVVLQHSSKFKLTPGDKIYLSPNVTIEVLSKSSKKNNESNVRERLKVDI